MLFSMCEPTTAKPLAEMIDKQRQEQDESIRFSMTAGGLLTAKSLDVHRFCRTGRDAERKTGDLWRLDQR